MKYFLLALLFAGCSEVVNVPEEQTDVQNREGCVYVQLSLLQGQDTVKQNYWITHYVDEQDVRNLFNESGLIISIWIPSIIFWEETNYCNSNLNNRI